MTKDDIKIIQENMDNCCTCKHYAASLCNPSKSNNSWESWISCEVASCRRYPPVFVAIDVSNLDDDGLNLNPINFQFPSICAYSNICGEYARADWVPNHL